MRNEATMILGKTLGGTELGMGMKGEEGLGEVPTDDQLRCHRPRGHRGSEPSFSSGALKL